MNLYVSTRSCCEACTDQGVDCHGCIVGIHMCDKPEPDCLKEDREAKKC